jgi:hypothetical protein
MHATERTAAGLAAVAIATVWLHLALPVPSDVGWLLSVNEKLFDGQRLYADVLETNPPMAVWIYTVPVALERLTGLRAEGFAVLETVAAGLLSLWVATIILGGRRLAGVPAALAAAVLLLIPLDMFAQREHFVLFGLLPWLAAMIRRDGGEQPGAGWSVVAGGALAVALAIKPQYLLVVALVALVLAIRRRSLRPVFALEHWIALVLCVAYGAVILLAYPTFLTLILPEASMLYVPLRMETVRLLLRPPAPLVYLVVLLGFTTFRHEALRDGMPLILTAIVGSFFVYVVQGKGWGYHLLPGASLALLAVIGMALAAQRATGRWIAAAVTVLGAMPSAAWALNTALRPEPLLALSSYGSGRTVELISSDIALASPVVRQLGDRLSSSSPMLWRATGAINLRGQATPQQAAVLTRYEAEDYRLLAKDLKTAPDLVLADTEGYDWLAWARRDAEVRQLLEAYSTAGAIATQGTTVTVLRRKGP